MHGVTMKFIEAPSLLVIFLVLFSLKKLTDLLPKLQVSVNDTLHEQNTRNFN